MEKAKIMGEITINVRHMTPVNVKQENKYNDFDSYVQDVQKFLQTS